MLKETQPNHNKNTTKNSLIKLMIILALILFIFAANRILSAILGNFTSTFSGIRTGYTGNEDKNSFSANYLSLNGTIRKKIIPKGDALHISVMTKSGTLTVEVQDADDNIIFDTTFTETETYDVPVSGKVTIRMKGENHNGSIEIHSEP